MPCPTCQHTVQNLGTEGRVTWWCPRCGTLKIQAEDAPDDVAIPSLVGYVDNLVRQGDWYWRAAGEAAGVKGNQP